ncbi:MAG: MBOAT family protein [Oscillospiraceae bacterium]|nr:MBOAT family protein [Oscillospiraceae bacterium]
MSFTSIQFLIFFPAVTILYFVIPQKARWAWLLAASYYFFMSWNPYYAILLAVSTVVTWTSGLLIGREDLRKRPDTVRRKKIWVALSVFVNIGILVVFKYLDFFCGLYAEILHIFGISAQAVQFDLLLPVGISFYTFQALSYTVDVYRGDIKPEKNLGKYALFVSFFPQLVAGPIEKSKDLLPQFDEVHTFDYDRVRKGLLLMLWGYFQKTAVADRLAQLVNTVYNSPQKYSGLEVAVATVFFAFQIYCDFAGYSNIAIGAAQVMGFRLTKNFDKPYFSKSIKEFWRRWHITLGAWFRDYLYIPLGGNRCSKRRHCLNLMIVFAVCGLWHGASMTFVIWGLLHGVYQVIGLLTRPAKQRAEQKLGIRENSFPVRLYRAAATFVLVDFAWIFFRADSLWDAAVLIGNLFRFNPAAFWNGSLFSLGLAAPDFWAALLGIAAVTAADLLSRRRDLRQSLLNRGPACRWAVYIAGTMVILIFGIYGPLQSPSQFIYFQF